jgi:hypothetical protein
MIKATKLDLLREYKAEYLVDLKKKILYLCFSLNLQAIIVHSR